MKNILFQEPLKPLMLHNGEGLSCKEVVWTQIIFNGGTIRLCLSQTNTYRQSQISRTREGVRRGLLLCLLHNYVFLIKCPLSYSLSGA